MSKNPLRATAVLTALGFSSLMALADSVNSTTISSQTVSTGDTTVIQHVDSKMEPIAVQSRTTTDSDGTKEKVVEPLIMERHDKVLDTTIIQPQVTETTKTTKTLVESKQSHSIPRYKHKASTTVHHHLASQSHHAYVSHAPKTRNNTSTAYMQTTEVTRQPVVKETVIKSTETSAPAEPQVVQKTEVK